MDRIMVDFVKFLNSSHSGIDKLHHDYSYTTTQRAHKGVGKKVCSIIYALNFKNKFLIKHAKGISQKDICKRILKMNLKEALQENIYFQNNISRHNPFPKTQLQTTMNKIPSKADMKGKGKAPAVQSKEIRKASVKISDKHEGVSIETISLQDMLLAEAMYSCGEKSEMLQEVLRTDLTFQNGEFTDLPFILNYFFIIFKQPSPLNRNPHSKRPLRL